MLVGCRHKHVFDSRRGTKMVELFISVKAGVLPSRVKCVSKGKNCNDRHAQRWLAGRYGKLD